jgi:gliding motility-associated-like protein
MKKQLLLFLALTIYSSIFAQNLQWVKSFGDTGGEGSTAVTTDAAGNVYTTGWFGDTVDFDPSASTYTLTAINGKSVFISKFDGAGNFIWAKALLGNAQGEAIAVDALGNVYTSGYFYNTTDFDPGLGVFNLTSNGMEDIYVSKIDPLGNFIWAKSFGSSIADYVYGITLDANNNVLVTGTFRNTCDFDPGASSFNITSNGVADFFISKFDASGTFIWAKSIGDIGGDESRSICVDNSGDIFLTGSYTGTVDFDPGAAVFNLSAASSVATDLFILKLNSAGSLVWVKNLGAVNTQGMSIALDATGNIYTSGYFYNTVDFDPGPSIFNLIGIPGQMDVFILKLNSLGNFVWANQINGTATYVGDIDLDVSGNLYITGVFSNTVDFDPSGSVFNLSATGASQNIFISKLNSSGNFLWAGNCDGASFATAYSMEVDALNNIYITGLFDNTVDFNPNVGVFNLTSNGSHDAYILKLGAPCAITSSVVSQSNVNCFGLANGSVTVSVSGGAIPYTYSWSPNGGNSNIASGLSANTYTCFISDNLACSTTQTVIITEPSAITSSISSQANLLCNGFITGSVSIAANGGAGSYTYSWSPTGGTSSSITNQSAGTYTCIINDVNLCSKTQTVTITEPTAITSAISSQTNISCNAGNNGSALINATGGTGTLTFSWVPTGGNSALASSLTAGNYTCTIKDINNCVKQQTLTISQPNAITTSVSSQTNVSCFGGLNGAVSLSVSGGAGTYSYSWAPTGGNTSIANNISSGIYTCTISDINNCVKSTFVTITEPSVITASASSTPPSCIEVSDGTALLNVNGGVIPYSIIWSNGSTTTQNTNLSAGNYSVNITDANSCTYSLNVLIQDASLSCFIIPNGFSPNGDGINDTWEIAGINNYPNAQITVLNRWGQEMLNTNNYSTPWDGTFNGGLLPTSDYYYIINLNDGSKALTGTLTIKR